MQHFFACIWATSNGFFANSTERLMVKEHQPPPCWKWAAVSGPGGSLTVVVEAKYVAG
jgi:hypothetical protein